MPSSPTDASVLTVGEKSSEMGVVHRTDEDVEKKNLTEIEREVVEAEDFIVYGRASVEAYDEDTISQRIEMEAFEEQLDQFFAQGGNISYKHKDVIVGKALREHELDSDVAVTVGDEEYEFEAGDTLRTHVEDDTLWLVAHIYGENEDAGSDASLMTRLGAFRGELDGFSVTIKNKAYRNTQKGQVIEEIDFHSVTVGTGEQIKNPDSLFGVAEFKLLEGISDALRIDTQSMELNILKALRSKSTEAMTEEVISHALTDSYDLKASAEELTEGEGVDEVYNKAEERLSSLQEKADEREDLVALLEDMTNLSSDEINKALDEMLESEGTHSDEMDEDDKEDEDMEEEAETDAETEEKQEDFDRAVQTVADEMGVDVSEVMDALAPVGEDADESEDEDMEEEAEADSDEKADADSEDEPADSEVETEEKSLTEDDVEQMVEEKFDAMLDEVGEKMDAMEQEVAEQVSERISEKMESGSTPESDANPTEDGTRNLLSEW